MADLGDALQQFLNRVSELDDPSDTAVEDADWFLLTRYEIRFSTKPGPRPYLRIARNDAGMITLYPRTSLKGDTSAGTHYPDQTYPHGVRHNAHTHVHPRCDLTVDATVLACQPRPVGAYVLRGRTPHCVERDATWLQVFCTALDDLESLRRDGEDVCD